MLCILYKICIIFDDHLKSHCKSFHFYSDLYYILQQAYQSVFFDIYNLYNLDILQYHMIYYAHIHIYQDSKINPSSHLPLPINSFHSHLHLSLFKHCLLLQRLVFNLHLHEQDICYNT